MPLPSPILDDRSYAQLAAELKARIPVYNPTWTDHNESDPGITLLELFAFQAESLLFRFNQIPEASYLEYLKLLQIPLLPAQPARALLALTTDKAAGVAVPQKTVAKAGKVEFQTVAETHAWPVSCVALSRARADAPSPDDESEVHAFVLRTVDALPDELAERPRVYYSPRVLDPAKLAEPVDFSTAVDGMIWIALLAEDGFDLAQWQKPDGQALLNLGFEPALPVGGIDQIDPCLGVTGLPSPPQLSWQISTARPLKNSQPQYANLKIEADSTRGLTQGGTVRLSLPNAKNEIGLPAVDIDLAGAGDFPPLLDDEQQAKLVAWVRVFRRDGSRFGQYRLIIVNATEAEQARVADAQYLGDGNGQPGQQLPLAHRPVLPDDHRDQIIVEVEEGGRVGGQWVRYSRVDDFFGSGRESRHVMLDPEAGTLRFGDGLRGRIPQWGERIRVRGYRWGGGVQGNVAAKAIAKIDLPGVKVSNPLPAVCGADAEGVEAALARIPGELRRRDRTVTADDFKELAAMTPGAQVGRAECLPRFHPKVPDAEAAGVVSVVVWPQQDPDHPNAPMPDAAMLRAVCQWLDQRRLVTTELYVLPPTYRKVAVSVALKVKPGYGIEAVRKWVELVLRQYLAPLSPYGPAGQGWPLGRRVYGPELEAAALQVEGVEYLEGLGVAGWNGAQWVAGTVELKRWEVPELAAITVVDGLPLPAPGEGINPVPPDGVVLPIPVLREEC
ncbi:putative baseplate assembly protein [Chitinivorax sp. B]|uniref:putative baseplate assembly protein n=1 Tax=Chitinivorax sp. B TaxID=2502235 RepID=UPI0010F66D93|nr:putative baseplate assembly protein [Chitinivorax sp. B]